MELTLKIPDQIRRAIRLPEPEKETRLRSELAVALYEHSILSFGKARELARMTKWRFHSELGGRQVPRHYGEADLREDVRHARKAR
jgi:predicted HTH domain antitoxin